MNLIFLGPPGSGKGTQAVRLAEKVNVLHLSTGDLLRAAVANGTELGKKAEGFMKAGELVPDDIIIGLIEEKQKAGDLTGGFILDGFPRTIPQAEALDVMFDRGGMKIDNTVLLSVPDEEIVKRLSSRVTVVDGKEIRRPDDQPEVVRNRLEVYRKQTQPIEDYYRNKGVLLEIHGVGTMDEIFDRICIGLGV